MADADKPLVSAVVPTFNRAHLLPVAVRSVISQSWRPLELVISNDGSEDNTLEVIEQMRPEVEGAGVKLTVASNPNGGRAAARNAGVNAASGEWVAFLDDDDNWAAEKTAKQMQRLRETGADAACCYLLKKNSDGETRHPAPPKRLMDGFEPAAWVRGEAYAHINSVIFRRALWPKVGEFDRELVKSQDVEWIGRLVHVATFCAVEEVLGVYEFNPGGITRANSLDDLVRADHFLALVHHKLKQRNGSHPQWDEQGWRERAARDFDRFVKNLLYAGRLREARVKWGEGMELTAGHERLQRTRRKLRKAAWLRLIGRTLKHPKLKGRQVRE